MAGGGTMRPQQTSQFRNIWVTVGNAPGLNPLTLLVSYLLFAVTQTRPITRNSEGRIRTCDLRLMGPASCTLLHPALFSK